MGSLSKAAWDKILITLIVSLVSWALTALRGQGGESRQVRRIGLTPVFAG